MKNIPLIPKTKKTSSRPRSQSPRTGKGTKPVARWVRRDGQRYLAIENGLARIELWPDFGGAIASYVDCASGIDIIWRNPYGWPRRTRVLDQPISGGSDLYDVMDGSWYVSLPTGFFPTEYFGAPIGTHGELRALPWEVTEIAPTKDAVRVALTGRSVRTPLVYHRVLELRRGDPLLYWTETVENRAAIELPVAWLQHPTFGGELLHGARLITPARTVRVAKSEQPDRLQLRSGYKGHWPFVPERIGGVMRDCCEVPPAGSGKDHSVELSDFDAGWGCVWNERRGLGFGMEWELDKFPYAWSWNCAGGLTHYPLWGEGHIITLQPSTSPIGRFADLCKRGALLTIPARGSVSTKLTTGFVTKSLGPWSATERTFTR